MALSSKDIEFIIFKIGKNEIEFRRQEQMNVNGKTANGYTIFINGYYCGATLRAANITTALDWINSDVFRNIILK